MLNKVYYDIQQHFFSLLFLGYCYMHKRTSRNQFNSTFPINYFHLQIKKAPKGIKPVGTISQIHLLSCRN